MNRRGFIAAMTGGLLGCGGPPEVFTGEGLPLSEYTPLGVEEFGGWFTLDDADKVASGFSPDLRDVVFDGKQVGTRPGLGPMYAAISGNPKVNGLHNFVLPDASTMRLLVLTNLGELYKELAGALSLIRALPFNGFPVTGRYMNSITAFLRAYSAYHDGKAVIFPSTQFDDTNLERYTQEGPAVNAGFPACVLNAAAGSIVAGAHKLAVIFVFRSGLMMISRDSVTFTAAGAQQVDVSAIPVGPSNVVARILAWTAAGGSEFYYIAGSAMYIPNNTATTVTGLNFSDTALLAGVNVDHLFRLITISGAGGQRFYKSRIVSYACRTQLRNSFVNLGFDGDFYTDGTGGNMPRGWVSISGGGAGPGRSDKESTISVFGHALTNFGTDGPTITQLVGNAGVEFDPGKRYSIRVWARRSAGLVGGQVDVHLGSTFPNAVRIVGAGLSSTQFTPQDAVCLPAGWAAIVAAGSAISIYVQNSGALTAGQNIYIDEIEIFETDAPFESSVFHVSRSEEPDAIDGVDGFVQAGMENGQAARNAFEIGGLEYLVKEHSLFVTEDTDDAPAKWPVREVSSRVGTPSLRGVGVGDEWAVIAHRSGLWFFHGGELSPENCLTTEIAPTWESISWNFGHTIEVVVDTEHKRIHVSVPLDGATEPNRVLTLDYTRGFGLGLRRWCPWYISANSMTVAERSTGTQRVMVGNNVSNGLVYQLLDIQKHDNGVAINSYWQSHYMGAMRSQFGYLMAQMTGVGSALLYALRGNQGDIKQLRGWTLNTNGYQNFERQMNMQRERIAFRIGTNEVNEYFTMKSFTAFVKKAAWAAVRGRNI